MGCNHPSGGQRHGAAKMSTITDYGPKHLYPLRLCQRRCPGFTDGNGIIDQRLYCDGSGDRRSYERAEPIPTHETVDKGMQSVPDGKSVFKVAVIGMADVSAEIMSRNT